MLSIYYHSQEQVAPSYQGASKSSLRSGGISGPVWTQDELIGLLVTPIPETRLKKRADMSRILLGIICGLVFGAIDIGIILPMSFPDKKAAITAAFIARFGIGFVIGAARLPWPGWAVGLIFGLLLSIPDAIITKAYGPIIGMGAIGGTIIGVIIGRFGR